MPKHSVVPEKFATNSGGVLCDEIAASVRLSRNLSEVARSIFDKPYRCLVDVLKISERDAHYRLAGRRKYTAVEIARLLQSEDGIHFLVALMENARPRWWRAVLKMAALGSIEQRRQADLKLMRKVFDADQAAASAFSDSFCAQDEDFYRGIFAGSGWAAALGVPDRAMVPQRKR